MRESPAVYGTVPTIIVGAAFIIVAKKGWIGLGLAGGVGCLSFASVTIQTDRCQQHAVASWRSHSQIMVIISIMEVKKERSCKKCNLQHSLTDG